MQTSTFWIVLIACIGGVVVLVGLLFEAFAVKKWFRDIRSFRRWQTLRVWGEWLVIGGIVIEIIVAGFTAIDEWGIKQIAIRNDPHKQPIFAFSAYACVVVRPSENSGDLDNTNLPSFGWAENAALFPYRAIGPHYNDDSVSLFFGRASQMAKSGAGASDTGSSRSDTVIKSIALYGSEKLLRFDVYFGIEAGNKTVPTANRSFYNPSLTPDDLKAVSFMLPCRGEVVGGIIEMNIDNGLVQRSFQIPKQRAFGNTASSVATNGTFIPLDWSPEIRADFDRSERIRLKKGADEADFAKTGAELEAKANSDAKKDRIISGEQRGLFMSLVAGYPRTPIKVFVNAGDAESIRYAQRIRLLLDDAGYSGTNSNVITNDGWIYFGTNFVRWEPTPHTLIFAACPEQQFGWFLPVHTPFDSIKPVISSGLTNDPAAYALGSLECVRWAFSGIGLTGFYISNTNILNYGETGIIVPPRGK
jgi:hypothetical protein